MPLRRELADPLGRDVVPDDLAVDLLLPHPPGDQLGVLRAEIQHQDLFVGKPAHASLLWGKPRIIGCSGKTCQGPTAASSLVPSRGAVLHKRDGGNHRGNRSEISLS